MGLCLSRKLLPWNNRLRRASSPTSFSPSRWWPGFVPFTRRSFCPWMIQLSPSCRNPFQRPVAVWLRASPSNAPFVTLKRRQLVCGVCLLGWLGGLWGGLLDSGDSAGWLSDPLRPSTSSIRVASLSLLAYSRQPIKVVALIQELQTPLRKGAVEPAPQSPGFYNSLFLIQKASGSWHPIIDFSP